MFNQFNSFSREILDDFRNFALQNRQNIDLITSRLLLTMGFKLHLKGSKYLREAILQCHKLLDESQINFSAEIYPVVARKFKTAEHNVEHNIRTAIHNTYNSGSLFIFNKITGYETVSHVYTPTNTEFILQVAEWINSLK